MFDDEECGQPHGRPAKRGHRVHRPPAVFARGDQAVRQRAQPHHAQRLARRIECRVLGVRAFLDAPCPQRDGQRADRQVDQEDALPT
ncbi:hypothetical protein G6F24_015834 [Rhizopus arrhizus]|nr:hypothetical protein G6F24_015834 [Rhizopus arrhizus]